MSSFFGLATMSNRETESPLPGASVISPAFSRRRRPRAPLSGSLGIAAEARHVQPLLDQFVGRVVGKLDQRVVAAHDGHQLVVVASAERVHLSISGEGE